MKDFIKAKIDEARDAGRDISVILEEMFMHIAAKLDGDDVDKEDPPSVKAE